MADSPSGQRVKGIFDKHRCQDLCENDLLLSINGYDLLGKTHGEVVEILMKCSKEIETVFVIRRGRRSSFFFFHRQRRVRRREREREKVIGRHPLLVLYTSARTEH